MRMNEFLRHNEYEVDEHRQPVWTLEFHGQTLEARDAARKAYEAHLRRNRWDGFSDEELDILSHGLCMIESDGLRREPEDEVLYDELKNEIARRIRQP